MMAMDKISRYEGMCVIKLLQDKIMRPLTTEKCRASSASSWCLTDRNLTTPWIEEMARRQEICLQRRNHRTVNRSPTNPILLLKPLWKDGISTRCKDLLLLEKPLWEWRLPVSSTGDAKGLPTPHGPILSPIHHQFSALLYRLNRANWVISSAVSIPNER